MKAANRIFLFALLLFALTSCTKESFDDKIVGKWEIREVFDGYVMGGNFQWNSIPDQQRHSIQFFENGSFVQTREPGNLPNLCTGTYTLINKNEISLNSSCNIGAFTFDVNFANNALIITHHVIEGEIKEKFIRVQ